MVRDKNIPGYEAGYEFKEFPILPAAATHKTPSRRSPWYERYSKMFGSGLFGIGMDVVKVGGQKIVREFWGFASVCATEHGTYPPRLIETILKPASTHCSTADRMEEPVESKYYAVQFVSKSLSIPQ